MKVIANLREEPVDVFCPIAIFGEPVEVLDYTPARVLCKSKSTGRIRTVSIPGLFYQAEDPSLDVDKDFEKSINLSNLIYEHILESDKVIA